MTNRTEELRAQGHTEPANDLESQYENTPFIRWGDKYNWVEGVIEGFFETKYGQCATLLVANVYSDGDALMAQYGQDPAQPVAVGQKVNIGLYNAALQGKITEDKVGHSYHIAFEQWHETKNGNKMRQFVQFDLGKTDTKPEASEPQKTETVTVEKVAEIFDAKIVDNDLPF